MDAKEFLRRHWPVLAVALVVVLVFAGLVGTCSPEPTADQELARTARTAIESAERARRENDAAYLWPARLRLVAIVVGVSVPIVAAVVLVYLVTRHRPDETELLTQLERHGLILPGQSPRQLASSRSPPELTVGEHDKHQLAEETPLPVAPPSDADKPE